MNNIHPDLGENISYIDIFPDLGKIPADIQIDLDIGWYFFQEFTCQDQDKYQYKKGRVVWFKPISLNHWFKPWFKPP